MSGGKGGSQTTQVEIPDWIEQPARRNIARAEQLAQVGYMPYYGPSVAAFSPMQTQAMQSTADAAAAFGLAPQMDVQASLPTPTDYGNGLLGYGTGQLFEESLSQLQQAQPAQYAQFQNLFAGPNPPTGTNYSGPGIPGFFPPGTLPPGMPTYPNFGGGMMTMPNPSIQES
jgi:hypothetical protein